jgi:hypothetical protein
VKLNRNSAVILLRKNSFLSMNILPPHKLKS